MKKIITAVAMASLLSGCQLIEQLQGKGGKQQPSTLPTSFNSRITCRTSTKFRCTI